MEIAPRVSSADQSQFNDVQSLLCASLQSILKRVSHADALQLGDDIFRALASMLQMSTTNCVQEDALMAMGSLIELLGDAFKGYLPAFTPFLGVALQARAEHWQVSFITRIRATMQTYYHVTD